MNNKVTELLRAHICAQGYFSANDEKTKDDVIFNHLVQAIISFLAVREIPPNTIGIILSGKFAELFLKSKESKDLFDVVSIMVGVEDKNNLDLSTNPFLTNNTVPKNWIFIDDSYYAGSIRDRIKDALHEVGLKLVHTYVIFDGSLFSDENISSLYNYYES